MSAATVTTEKRWITETSIGFPMNVAAIFKDSQGLV
jgi:hypothetical protein